MNCCKHLQKYDNISSKKTLDLYGHLAAKYVHEGTFRLIYKYDFSSSYMEQQYICNHCGTKYVLWIDASVVRSGGEWRAIL